MLPSGGSSLANQINSNNSGNFREAAEAAFPTSLFALFLVREVVLKVLLSGNFNFYPVM